MMATNENKIEKLIGRHHRGLLTENEVVHGLLLALAEVDEAQCVTSLFDVLPVELQSAVCSQLNAFQGSDFNWRPFMIGDGFSEAELARIKSQLRFIHGTLCDSD